MPHHRPFQLFLSYFLFRIPRVSPSHLLFFKFYFHFHLNLSCLLSPSHHTYLTFFLSFFTFFSSLSTSSYLSSSLSDFPSPLFLILFLLLSLFLFLSPNPSPTSYYSCYSSPSLSSSFAAPSTPPPLQTSPLLLPLFTRPSHLHLLFIRSPLLLFLLLTLRPCRFGRLPSPPLLLMTQQYAIMSP